MNQPVSAFKAQKKELLEAHKAWVVDNHPLKIPETTHFWADGAYVRRMHLDKHDFCIGKRHNFACVNVIASGCLQVRNVADDQDVVVHEPGAVFVSPAGTEREIFALEETYWITCHATEETDLDKIEQLLVGES